MTAIVVYAILLILLTPPLGAYMYRVYTRERTGWAEGLVYRLIGVDPKVDQSWRRYASACIWFSGISMIFIYAMMRLQAHLPLNPNGIPAVNQYVSFNTAASFTTNTNWQAYGGETTMSYLTQMASLTFQNFISAAVGMAVLVALIRGIVRSKTGEVGNFWVDVVRTVLYILLPLAVLVDDRAHHAGRRPDPRRERERSRHPGLQADPGPRPGGQPDRHQAARDQRRRVLQRQLRPPVRGRHAVRKLHREHLHPADPRRAHLHLRAHGRQREAGMGDLLGHVGPDGGGARDDRARRALRHPGHAGRWDLRVGAEPRGQGGPVRSRRLVAVGGRDHRRIERQRQLDARLVPVPGDGRADVQPRRRRGDLGRRRAAACTG